MELTPLEASCLAAILRSEYFDAGDEDLTQPVWMFSVRVEGKSRYQISGAIGSLTKKGFVITYKDGDEEVIRMTDEGASAFKAARKVV